VTGPPVYADENVSRRVTDALRERGFDVLTAYQATTLGQDDASQLTYAASLGRVLLTFDGRDFRRAHSAFLTQGGSHAGIILLPQSPYADRNTVRAAMMLHWLASHEGAGSLLLNWNDLQRRLHDGLRIPGFDNEGVRLALGRA